MRKQYLAFWHDGAQPLASVVTAEYPPHEPPRGSILLDFVEQALHQQSAFGVMRIDGVVELPRHHNSGPLEIVFGPALVASVDYHGPVDGWRLYR